MADSIRDLFFGTPASELVEALEPRRTFDDVVLPETTLRSLNHALALVRKHDLIFRQWGLAERHSSGLGLAFHFAGPPGTGKTICAEALAYTLDQRLLVVRYAELESRWVGQTAKHVASVFRAAERQNAVLFFDEADAIAGRRFTSMSAAYEREANAIVNVLLQELESFDGVVIFATNLAANIDPAFERRIRTHILFDMPNAEERERIWRVQLHAKKTPLAEDVDFRALAERYPRSGGDIKNAVLKAAQIATTEPGPDAEKQIHQRHFVAGMEEVLAAERVMGQSLFDSPAATSGRRAGGDGGGAGGAAGRARPRRRADRRTGAGAGRAGGGGSSGGDGAGAASGSLAPAALPVGRRCGLRGRGVGVLAAGSSVTKDLRHQHPR